MSQLQKGRSLTINRMPELQPIASGLLAFCHAKRDHYRKLGMEVEALAFDVYMKQIAEDFGISPTSSSMSTKGLMSRVYRFWINLFRQD